MVNLAVAAYFLKLAASEFHRGRTGRLDGAPPHRTVVDQSNKSGALRGAYRWQDTIQGHYSERHGRLTGGNVLRWRAANDSTSSLAYLQSRSGGLLAAFQWHVRICVWGAEPSSDCQATVAVPQRVCCGAIRRNSSTVGCGIPFCCPIFTVLSRPLNRFPFHSGHFAG